MIEVEVDLNEVVNVKADEKIESALATWDSFPKFKNTIQSIVDGGDYRGFKCGRIQHTDKIGVEVMSYRDNTGSLVNDTGYFGNVPIGRIDVPAAWFRCEFINAVQKNIDWYRYDHQSGEHVSAKSLMNSKSNQFWLLKLVMMARDSGTRRSWNSKVSTLIRSPDYRIGCKVKDASITEVVVHPALIKEEHANKGFLNTKMPDSVFAYNHGEGIVAMEDPKKVLARVSRLVQHPDAVDIGEHDFFLLDDVPGAYKEWFVSGSVYTPRDTLMRLGGFRAVNHHGIKMTSMITPTSWENPLAGKWLAAASAFKSQHNGVAHLLSGVTHAQLAQGDEFKISSFLEEKRETILIDGVEFSGWTVKMNVRVTSLYSLYGLRTNSEMSEGIDECINDDGDIESTSSFYTEAMDNLESDSDYDVLGSTERALESGTIRYAKQTVDMKMQEFSVAYWSYGESIAKDFMKGVVKSSRKFMRSSTRESWDVMSYKSKAPVMFDLKGLEYLTKRIYPKAKGLTILPGVLDADKYPSTEQGIALIDELLNGIPDSSWDGLLGESDKLFTIDGHQFYIPGGSVMKEFAFPEKGSNRWFMSGPATVLQKLMVATRGKEINWGLKSVNHDMDLQSSLLGKSMDSFTVPGFGNKAMLPAPWLKQNELVVLDPDYKSRNGMEVTGSKMPVLFNKAVSGYTMYTGLPRNIFGEIDKRMKLAMKNMVFVNIDVMIDHQNDTDGDMFRVALVDGLPQYDGLPTHMSEWRDSYAKGEYDLRMKFKPYTSYRADSIHNAVIESADNKNYVGKATNDLALLSHILQLLVSKGKYIFDSAMYIRDAYAMGMQDDVVRGIKWKSGDLFKSASMWAMLYGDFETKYYARQSFRMLISNYIPHNILLDLEILFIELDELIEANDYDGSPLSARKVRKLVDHDYAQVQDEFIIKELDMLTRSYIINAHVAQPTYRKLAVGEPAERQACAYCMDHLFQYRDKYVLWGQEFPDHENTVIGSVLSYWRHLDLLDVDNK